MPLFSVVIPTYNRANLLCKTIDSILEQRCKDYEIIIVDDGSTDDTVNKLSVYGKEIKIYSQENRGCDYARNTGIKNAKGEYIVGFDSDDLFFPYTLGVYKKIISELNPAILIGQQLYISEIEKYKGYKANLEEIKYMKFQDFFTKNISLGITNSGLVIKRELLNKVGGYELNSYGSDDHALLMKLGVESPLIIIQSPLTFAYRVHPNNTVRNIKWVTNGIKTIAESERSNHYPGGKKRRFERRAIIGTNAIYWIKEAMDEKNIHLAADIIFNLRSMLIIALLRKTYTKFFNKNKIHSVKIQSIELN